MRTSRKDIKDILQTAYKNNFCFLTTNGWFVKTWITEKLRLTVLSLDGTEPVHVSLEESQEVLKVMESTKQRRKIAYLF